MTNDTTPQSPDDKRRVHLARTKKAILTLAASQGGSCEMSAMHELSESQFFIAHQNFSKLLEECVAEGLVEVTGHTVALTEKGTGFVAE